MSLPPPALYESHCTTVRHWSFDLFRAPKDFQKCPTTSITLALVSLRAAATPAEVLGDNVYLQAKYDTHHGQFTLDVDHKPLHRLPELLREAAAGMEPGHRLAVLKLGPRWYAYALAIDADWGYDYALLMRRQMPGEDKPAPYEERGYFVVLDDGTIV